MARHGTAAAQTRTLTLARNLTLSPNQAQSWPILAEGSDLIAVAKTGSGKTLGFLLPIQP